MIQKIPKTKTHLYLTNDGMKTNSILLATLVFAWTLFSLSTTHAAAVVPLSSGVKTLSYSLEWCSPHYKEFVPAWPDECRLGYFEIDSGIAKVTYNGTSFPTGNVSLQTMATLLTTRTPQTIGSLTNYVNFFTWVTNGAFAIEWEGVLTIRTLITDYAGNTSNYKVSYKVDKTAPELAFNPLYPSPGSITFTPGSAYYNWNVNTSLTVTKNDSVNTSSTQTATFPKPFSDPDISSYVWDSATTRSHVRTDLPAYYFKDLIGSFTLNETDSDEYGSYLQSTASSLLPDWYTWPLTSGTTQYALVPWTSAVAGTAQASTAFTHSDLTANAGLNSYSPYRLRLYDNTVDALGQPGNYSETAFYAVRDNTPPNMLAGATDTKAAIEKLLSFDAAGSTTVWDQTTPGYDPSVAWAVSKFIAANKLQPLYSTLSDVGITWPSISTLPELYNAGLDSTAGPLKVKIQDESVLWNFDELFTYSNRWNNNNLPSAKDFSYVDNNEFGTNGYRKYTTNLNSMCDLVWNCLAPKLDFRVVAAWIDQTASNLTISTLTQTVAWKMIANGTDSYKLSYALKDPYGNKIVPVVSQENTGTPQIKTVDTTINFTNGLNVDQRSNTPTGVKLWSGSDAETDNIISTGDINTTGSFSMREDPANNNGVFSLKIASKVPTKAMYPYLSNGSVLSVASIVNTASGSAAPGMTYPATGSRIGYFGPLSTTAWVTNPIITSDNGNIGQNGNNLLFVFYPADYGKVTTPVLPTSFYDLQNRQASFEFASPVVYGLKDMTMWSLTNSVYRQHTKELYKIDSSITPNVYEKILVAYSGGSINTNGKDGQPNILDFTTRKDPSITVDTPINNGTCSASICLNMFSGTTSPVQLPFPINAWNTTAEIRMSPIDALKPYINANLHRAYVSALTYSPDGGTNIIQLPSVARDIKSSANTDLGQYDMTRAYFDNSYRLDFSTTIVQDTANVLDDIAITGLSNRYNGITTGTGGTKANVNIGKELTRMDLVTTIKKNVAILSAGFGPSAWKNWCSASTITQDFIDNTIPTSQACTQVINGETISFIDGNTTIKCSASNICHVSNGKRSIIVKNGSLYVKSDITTMSAGTQTSGQLFLGVMNDAGLTNVTVAETTPNIIDPDKKGWLFIDPNITNIDAFLFAQGPMVSYSDSTSQQVFYTKSTAKSDVALRNQLHIMGSLLTLNKIGESSIPKCPYIVANCTQDTATVFDLVNLRNFKFTSKSTYSSDPLDNLIMAPYHPNGNNTAKISGGTTETEEPSTFTCVWDLRCITDADYRGYPMLIERDLRWNTNRSLFFRAQN
jgi:hypothetical protein